MFIVYACILRDYVWVFSESFSAFYGLCIMDDIIYQIIQIIIRMHHVLQRGKTYFELQ